MPLILAGFDTSLFTNVFFLTVLFIFIAAIVTTFITKWSRDKCLKLFTGYHITLERLRGQTIWGTLKVFSSGIEISYDHAYIDLRGRRKTSFMIYQQEIDQQVLSLFRYHNELSDELQKARLAQIHRTFNPNAMRRFWRHVRNTVNTLRDAFNASIGAVVGQYQRANPANALMGTDAAAFTQIGQTLLGKFANAYEPLLEQYIGQPVILEVANPLNPNNATVEFPGYLADYTQAYIAVFNVEHAVSETIQLTLPDVERGDVLPPLPLPPPPGGMPIALPPPIKSENNLDVCLDGDRMRIRNARAETVVIRKMERGGFEPLPLNVTLPSMGTVDLPARDVRTGVLTVEVLKCIDIVAPRKYATIRHAGEQVDRPGIVESFHLDQLPLVPRLLGTVYEREPETQTPREAVGTSEEDD